MDGMIPNPDSGIPGGTALFYEASIRYRNNPAPSKKICDLEKTSVMTDRQTDRRRDTSRRRTDI